MVKPVYHVIDTMHRRVTSRCQNAFAIVAITIVLIAVVTDHIAKAQLDDAVSANGVRKQLMLSQRVALNVQEMLIQASPAARNDILQSLSLSVRQMEEAHAASLTGIAHRDASDARYKAYYAPPHDINKRVLQYLADAQAVLNTPANELNASQSAVANLLKEAQGPFYEHMQYIINIQQNDMLARLHGLRYTVAILGLLSVCVLVVVAVVVLKPAIAYIAQAQGKLNELNQLKSDFLANMSHEIRTPMNGIFGMAELLKESDIDERQQHYVRTLQSSADHLLGLINDILDFSKMEAGQMKLDPVRFNLHETIEEVMEVLSPRAREKNLELLLHYPPGTPRFILADPGRIRQVLFNLIGNAIKFTDKGYVITHVTILATSNKRFRLGIRIEDTGIGIPEDKINSLFEKFMQVESGSTRARQGTGLGLAISRNLVRLMGGDISVESVPGKGTSFSWHIEITEATEPAQEIAHSALLVGKRVMLVDDLAPNRQVFKELLTAAGMDCLVAENVPEALSMLDYEYDSKRTIHAVITDDLMPGMVGTDFCAHIVTSARYSSVPVIVLSAARPEDVKKRLNGKGAKAYFAKPVSHQQILESLAHIFEGKAAPLVPMVPEKEAITPVSPGTAANGRQILLVEDNKVNLEIISEMLSQLGCSVTTAVNGRQALEKIRSQPFDMVFMDCQMPEMDGFEAAGHLRSLKDKNHIPDVPVIALTANALKGDRERCLQSGMNDYLSKPVQKAQLQAMIGKWLASKTPLESVAGAIQASVPQSRSVPAGSAVRSVGIDLSAFTAARDVLGDKFSKVLSYYLEDAENYIDNIAEALSRNDLSSTVLPAHTLKSSSQQFGAMGLANLAARIEDEARVKSGNEAGMQLASLIVPMREALQQARSFYLSSQSDSQF
jgi:signal transduction histidine kinase/DNA-binding response OmpR family regulator